MKSFQKFLFLGFLPIIIISLIIVLSNYSSGLLNVHLNYFVVTFFLNISFSCVYVFEKLTGSFVKRISISIFILSNLTIITRLYFEQCYIENATIEFDLQTTLFQLGLNICVFFFYIFILDVNKKFTVREELVFEEKVQFYLKLVFCLSLILTLFLVFFYIFDYVNRYSIDQAFRILFVNFFGFCSSVTLLSLVSIYVLNKIKFLKRNFLIIIFLTSIISTPSIFFLGFPGDMNYFMGYVGSFYVIQLLVPTIIISILFYRFDKRNQAKQIIKLKSLNNKNEMEYLQLKNQVNPHFLFNNINVLISLIEIDPAKAISFGHNLSNVYRHYLNNHIEDFIPLKGELDFIKEYLEIYKAKFDGSFTFNMHIEVTDNYILTGCLQEIIDNIFKHNVLDELKPLIITFKLEDSYLSVSNSKNINQNSYSTSIGLKNIQKRYKLLIDKEVKINDEKDLFIVKLPIVKI